jgi:Na+/proline symporter
VLLVALGRIAAHAFPSLGHGIAMIVIFLAVIWCAVGLFIIASELLTKRTESDGDDKGI